MNGEKHYSPQLALGQYHCLHCGVFSKQYWAHIGAEHHWGNDSIIRHATHFQEYLPVEWRMSNCEHCGQKTIWFNDKIIYPKKMIVESPNDDLSADIKSDYVEAAVIYNDSVRASAALLRLALQKLCKQLGEKGENINDDIGNLVKKGLNPQIQKSLDILRITGNNAVHPGEIHVEEDSALVLKLFELINFIAEKMLSEPRDIDSFYSRLPEKSRDAVDKRDGIKQN